MIARKRSSSERAHRLEPAHRDARLRRAGGSARGDERRRRRARPRSTPSSPRRSARPGRRGRLVSAVRAAPSTSISDARSAPRRASSSIEPVSDDLAAVDDRRRGRTSSRPRRACARRASPSGPRRRTRGSAAELEDARRVEAVHRLVEDQQLGIGEQAARDAEPLAHAERVGLHAVARAVASPTRSSAGADARRTASRLAGGGDDRRGSRGRSGAGGNAAPRRSRRRARAPRRGARAPAARGGASCRRSPASGRAASGSASSCPRRSARGSRTRRRAGRAGRLRDDRRGSPNRFVRPCVSTT